MQTNAVSTASSLVSIDFSWEQAGSQSSTSCLSRNFDSLKLKLRHRFYCQHHGTPSYLFSPNGNGTVHMWHINNSLKSTSSKQGWFDMFTGKQPQAASPSLSLLHTFNGPHGADNIFCVATPNTSNIELSKRYGYYTSVPSSLAEKLSLAQQQQEKPQKPKPNSNYVELVSAGYNNTLCSWDVSTGAVMNDVIKTETVVWCLSFWYTPLYLYLIEGHFKKPFNIVIRQWRRAASTSLQSSSQLSSSSSPSAELFEQGRIVRTIKGHLNSVRRLIVLHNNSSNNSKHNALSPNDCLMSCSDDGTIRIWDLVTGEQLKCLEIRSKSNQTYFIYNMCLVNLNNSNDYNHNIESNLPLPLVCAVSSDNSIEIWNYVTATCLCQVKSAHTSYISSVLYSSTLNTLVTSSDDKTVKLWNINYVKAKQQQDNSDKEQQQQLLQLSLTKTIRSEISRGCKKMEFLDTYDNSISNISNGNSSGSSGGGTFVVVGQDRALFIIDLKQGETVFSQQEKLANADIWQFAVL